MTILRIKSASVTEKEDNAVTFSVEVEGGIKTKMLATYGKPMTFSGKKGWEVNFHSSHFPKDVEFIDTDKVMCHLINVSISHNNTLGGGTPYEFKPY